MTREHRIAATLGFAVPTALAGWIVFGVDAHAAPRELRPPWAASYSAYLTHTSLVRHCEPRFPTEMVCECGPRVEVVLAPDRVRAFIVSNIEGIPSYGPGHLALSVPRRGEEWIALERWLVDARNEPVFEGVHGFQLYAQGVAYRDVIRAFEVADHAGFDEPSLIPARAAESEHDRPLEY